MEIHVLHRARSSYARSKKVRQGTIEEEGDKWEEVHVPLLDLKASPMPPPSWSCSLGRTVRRSFRRGRHLLCQCVGW